MSYPRLSTPLYLFLVLTLSACQAQATPALPTPTLAPLPTASPAPTLTAPPTPDADQLAIQNARQAINVAFAQRDFATLLKYLTITASLTGPTLQAKGLSPIRDLFKGMIQSRPDLVFDFEPEKIQINPQWNLASENGAWLETWTENGDLTTLKGTYTAMWKKTTATWLMDSELYIPLECSGSSYCNQ